MYVSDVTDVTAVLENRYVCACARTHIHARMTTCLENIRHIRHIGHTKQSNPHEHDIDDVTDMRKYPSHIRHTCRHIRHITPSEAPPMTTQTYSVSNTHTSNYTNPPTTTIRLIQRDPLNAFETHTVVVVGTSVSLTTPRGVYALPQTVRRRRRQRTKTRTNMGEKTGGDWAWSVDTTTWTEIQPADLVEINTTQEDRV